MVVNRLPTILIPHEPPQIPDNFPAFVNEQ